MKNLFLFTMFIISTSLFTSNAYAGKWIEGKGATVAEAVANSLENAKDRVKKRGKGCVKSKTKNLRKENGVWLIQTFTSNHNGSCGN